MPHKMISKKHKTWKRQNRKKTFKLKGGVFSLKEITKHLVILRFRLIFTGILYIQLPPLMRVIPAMLV